jgi:hypothetical protein
MTEHEGGVEWELGRAEDAMIAAGDDPAALAKAMRRHTEGIRNMMQGAVVPSFVQLVERVLGEKIDLVAGKIDGLRMDVQHLASESATRLGKLEQRMDASEDDRADLRQRLERIEAILAARPGQRIAERQSLLDALHGARGDGTQ